MHKQTRRQAGFFMAYPLPKASGIVKPEEKLARFGYHGAMSRRFSFPLLAFLLLALALVSCAPSMAFAQAIDGDLPELGDAAGAGLSMQAEKKIGQEIMNEIRMREPTYLDDPEIEAYLNQLGNRLAAASPDPGIGFYFFPLNDPTINAFAMFGGYIGVNSGLILAVQNESELAGVLAHEISHVTQRHLARGIARQKQISGASLLAMAVAVLAARSNSDVAGAAMAGASAGALQAQLGFSRDFEREADRIGFQTLEKAGFDVRGMSAFFSRLQRATRVYENNAPVYLRTHPLNIERISDMQNREQGRPYRQAPDSPDFQFVRARLQAMRGTPAEAVAYFRNLLAEQKTLNVATTQYGLAVALARQKDWPAVEGALADVRQKIASPMIERLYAEARIKRGDLAGGLAAFRAALSRYPNAIALVYAYGEALLENRRLEDAETFLDQSTRKNSADARLYRLQARIYAARGKMGLQHKALAEACALEGQLAAAIEQLEAAQKAGGNDFYTSSAIEARLRQLKLKQREEARQEVKAW
jgi:predicted Zn-dependent protease